MIKIRSVVILLVILILPACQSKIDITKLEQELLELHYKTIQAHLDKNPDFFIQNISDDYMQVHNGDFLYPQKEEIQDMFVHYLNNTDFIIYEDLAKPIIKVSNDGSLGWTIVQVRVKGKQKSELDSTKIFDNTFAWITLYERTNNQWIRLGEVDNYKINE